MDRRMQWQRLAALLVIAMLAAACGDDGADEGETGAPAETGADSTDGTDVEEPSPAPADGTEAGGEPAGGGADTDDELVLGYILPETGSLAYLGPPMVAAVSFAVDRINEAGGVLGLDVPPPVAGDEAEDASIANQSADRLLAEGVDAIIGAAGSAMSLAIIDKVTGAGVVQCSGSNTAPTFTDYPDGGYYFRTAPTDALQGPVLAETLIADGAQSIVLMGRADDYGRGLVEVTGGALTEAGATVVEIIHDPAGQNFDAEVQQALDANADAVVVVAFEEGAQIIQGLIEGGLSADQLYGTDGVRSSELPALVDPNNPNVLDGMKGTAPAPELDEQFIADFTETSGLTDTIFAPQKYDCVNIVALAAEAAGSTAPDAIAAEINGVTGGGTTCTSFAECRDLLAAGEDIDYDGASGPLDFSDDGEPGVASYEVWAFEGGELNSLSTTESTLSG